MATLSSAIALALCLASVANAQANPPTHYQLVVEAHGIMGCLAMVIFFPVGAILLRTVTGRAAMVLHGAFQLFALVLLTANVGMGIWMGPTGGNGLNQYHQIIGFIVFCLAWLQSLGGVSHHVLYKKHGRRTLISHLHMRIGVIVITLGIINGGMGMMLSADTTTGEHVAYGIIAGFMWFAFMAAMVIGENRREAQLQMTPQKTVNSE